MILLRSAWLKVILDWSPLELKEFKYFSRLRTSLNNLMELLIIVWLMRENLKWLIMNIFLKLSSHYFSGRLKDFLKFSIDIYIFIYIYVHKKKYLSSFLSSLGLELSRDKSQQALASWNFLLARVSCRETFSCSTLIDFLFWPLTVFLFILN
jgi:hypothetical protein